MYQTEPQRAVLLQEFLQQHSVTTQPKWLPVDASTRRYGHISYGGKDYLLMDAVPNKATRTDEFIAIAQMLGDCGLSAPKIYAANIDQGFLIIENLGDELFSDILRTDPNKIAEIYRLALQNILHLQGSVIDDPNIGRPFDSETMTTELKLFRHWYCPAAMLHLTPQAWQEFDELVWLYQQNSALLPKRFVLRDCHVDNFVYRGQAVGINQCGILDFQDGGWGSALYDVTSLLFDARRDVPAKTQQELMHLHADSLGVDWAIYHPAAMYLVLQRALKVLGIFTRLNARDGKSVYLQHLKRCWQQVHYAADYLPDWKEWLDRYIPDHVPDHHDASIIDTAICLAAGQGSRMGALGAETPKPLLQVAGRSMIDRGQDHLRHAGLSRFVVNAHHHADQVTEHFADKADCTVITENARLETGGGVRNALSVINRDAFFILNGDSLWQNSNPLLLKQAVSLFYKELQDIDIQTYHELNYALLLLVPLDHWRGKDAAIDFSFIPDQGTLLQRGADRKGQGYGYSGVMLMHHAAIMQEPIEYFSLNRIFDQLIAQKKLHGLVVDWDFYHVGTPEALSAANNAFRVE